MSKSTAEIRQTFLDFFNSKGHEIVSSSSLVPDNDPTLLFTNAGMNQFKHVFLGSENRPYRRATTAQRCVRAGGKHNDLENVGYTARHHTFFEMLGNFSFGDYFKRDAIHFAWELLTSEAWFNIPAEKLWVTVYATDDEAYQIWASEIGVPQERIIRIGDNKGAPYASDNFWQMGDTGPCGPCTEIFFDHGDHIWGGPPGSPEEDGDRFIEIWNLVFMQFNRQSDGTLEPLPKPSVDTGMGLERIAAVLQHVNTNYDIDLFQTLIKAVANIANMTDLSHKSLRVIADHIRSCAFLIADGVMPSNEGRGYVLRRIIRRAIRHGHILGINETFFYQLVDPLIDVMGDAAVELERQRALVESVLKNEEEQFGKTLDRGLKLLDQAISDLDGAELSGDVAFRLYDTYGFPLDLTADVCRERAITIDEVRFDELMALQRQRARENSGFNVDYNNAIRVETQTEFSGYTKHDLTAKIIGLFVNSKPVERIVAGEEATIILDNTPFYAESGGQVGDQGTLRGSDALFNVTDTQKHGAAIGHSGKLLQGSLSLNECVDAQIDVERRERIRLNHSATHLLHAALRHILGEHVAQKGSLVTDMGLRFDFSHFEAISTEQLRKVEQLVNQQIRNNLLIDTEIMDLDTAKAKGAMALFGEKYSHSVRVLSMGDFSTELCGGTHADRTGDIGLFRIESESGIAAGVRRIEAVTGQQALQTLYQQDDLLANLTTLIKSDRDSLLEKLKNLLERSRLLEKEVTQLKEQEASQASALLLNKAIEVNGVSVLVNQLDRIEPKFLRIMVDDMKNRLSSGIIVLATIDQQDKISVIAGVTKNLTAQINAGELIRSIAEQIDGKGGGRSDLAQAGGTNISALPLALQSVKDWIAARLSC